MKIDRAEFRHAIADEVATLRAINTALRGPVSPSDAAFLAEVRVHAISVIRYLLAANYQPVAPKKPAASVRIREVSK